MGGFKVHLNCGKILTKMHQGSKEKLVVLAGLFQVCGGTQQGSLEVFKCLKISLFLGEATLRLVKQMENHYNLRMNLVISFLQSSEMVWCL